MLVGMDHPNSEGQGYDGKKGEYIPISLQYRPYTAESDSVRPVSLAGNTLEDGTQENRSYLGRTAYTSYEDVSGDTDPYVDASGNAYGFGFGLSCGGAPLG